MNKTLGATLLIAGCCVGAGMLGIPVVTGPAGFYPSVAFFVLAWIFMATTGLLLSKLVLSFDKDDVHLLSMCEATLGKTGKLIAWVLFAFLFYALMTAYVTATGTLISQATGLPFTLSSVLFSLVMFAVIARGVKLVDSFNRYLMVGFGLFYVLLVAFGQPFIDLERLERGSWGSAWISLPILVVSFGYHNLVPTLALFLKRDAKALTKAIWIGSAIPLLIYVIWEFVILGLVPVADLAEWTNAQGKGELVTQVLAETTGSKLVIRFAEAFAFFAIATSFLPVSYSFVDFLRDGLKGLRQKVSNYRLALLVLAPPLLLALSDPHIFLDALDFAGGFCAVILFGILPCLMALKKGLVKSIYLLPILIFALVILSIEIMHQLGTL
jgi:tyrosine-specific transport protein